ncbi:MAG: hypothetical protein ACXV3D_10040 [Halobacteriota archaeon]
MKLLRVVETLVDLLVGIVSDTAEMAIAPQFKPVKSLLEVARNHLVTPFNGRIFRGLSQRAILRTVFRRLPIALRQ